MSTALNGIPLGLEGVREELRIMSYVGHDLLREDNIFYAR